MELERWVYDFECGNCAQRKLIINDSEGRNGIYCMPTVEGRRPIHADDDRHVRCDYYEKALDQVSLFEEGNT